MFEVFSMLVKYKVFCAFIKRLLIKAYIIISLRNYLEKVLLRDRPNKA